jgi:lysozyme
MSSNLVDSVSAHEGFRATPYKDTEQLWTVAKGRCLETNPLSPAEWKYLLDNKLITLSVTLAGADWLMLRQIDATEKECARVFDFWPGLDEVRREALVEMGYQMGIERLLGFRRMLGAIRRQDWGSVRTEALDSRWARQTPKRAEHLANQLSTGVRE